MKKRVFLTGIVVWFCSSLLAQNSGIINYDITHNWIKKMANSKYISKSNSERAAYVWGEEEWTSKATLKFTDKQTLFEYLPDDDEERNWSSREEEYYIYRDLENNRMLDIVETLGKQYAIEDSMHCLNWKIGNGMKEIAGHICVSAYCYDSLREKEIVAWFALDMPGSMGPEGYCGLPGVILELNMNNGSVVYTATSIIPSTEEVPIAKPIIKKRRKIVTFAEYQAIEEKVILNCRKEEAPYFWMLSY
jgi:GLPGLI family protein